MTSFRKCCNIFLLVIHFSLVCSIQLDDIESEDWINRLSREIERRSFHRSDPPNESWKGRWFPEKSPSPPSMRYNAMISMINSSCDDGKTNLTVDWPTSFWNFTCDHPFNRFLPDPTLPALLIKELIPPAYHARHVCMNSEIVYNNLLPTFGPHRPAWPRYGEYKFVPIQRWLHSLEHGAVVMLYHPCAHPFLVSELRDVVQSCLYRYIITPYSQLTPERPFALVTWGWSLLMSEIDRYIAENFIRNHALKGPEQTSIDGQYDYMLIKPAKIVSTINDVLLCPLS